MRDTTGWIDRFWRWFNPPLPDVMQKRMISKVWAHQVERAYLRLLHNPLPGPTYIVWKDWQ